MVIINRFDIGSCYLRVVAVSTSRCDVRTQIGSGNIPTLIVLTMLADALISIFATWLTQDLMLQMWNH
jgi:hypothetical protein